jgi:hypothetical protein
VVYDKGPSDLSFSEGNARGTHSIFADEPTFFMPKGLDPSVSMRVGTDDETILIATVKDSEDSEAEEREWDLDDLARMIVEAEAPKTKGDGEEPDTTKILGYHVAIKHTFTFTVFLPNGHETSGELSDFQKIPGSLLSLDQLPPAILKELKGKVEEIKKQQDDDGGGLR